MLQTRSFARKFLYIIIPSLVSLFVFINILVKFSGIGSTIIANGGSQELFSQNNSITHSNTNTSSRGCSMKNRTTIRSENETICNRNRTIDSDIETEKINTSIFKAIGGVAIALMAAAFCIFSGCFYVHVCSAGKGTFHGGRIHEIPQINIIMTDDVPARQLQYMPNNATLISSTTGIFMIKDPDT